MIYYSQSRAYKNTILLTTLGLLLFNNISGFSSGINELSRDPVVGITQDNQATILVRGSSPGNVQIEFYEVLVDSQTNYTDWERLSYSKDLTVNLILKEIKYNVYYIYKCHI